MSMDGVLGYLLSGRSVNGDVFMDFVRRTLLPLLMPFDGGNERSVVVLDNASIHHVEPVVEAINSVGDWSSSYHPTHQTPHSP